VRWTGYVAHTGEMRNTYRILVVKTKMKRKLGRLRYSGDDNIKIDLNEIECFEGVDWIKFNI
jgi:hypothetical protein